MQKLLIILPLLLAGCTQPLADLARPQFLFGTHADPVLAADLAKLRYPREAPVGRDLDILMLQKDRNFTFVNRTTEAHKNVQLWLNQQYVGLIDEIPIGMSPTFQMGHFINQYGEAYPIGGLLNPDKSYPLVLAELYNPSTENSTGQRHKIVVRSEDVEIIK